MKTVEDVHNHLTQKGEMDHETLKRDIFEAGGMPDARFFMQLLKSKTLKRTVSRDENNQPTVLWSAKAE